MNASPFAVSDLRRYLAGRWTLRRVIEDRLRGTTGRFEGESEFAPEAGALLYRETGRLVIESYEGDSFRAYRYEFPAPARALVSFEDGSRFHELDLSNGTWDASHVCDPDLYAGRFTAADADEWESVWGVKGPRKDLVLRTEYTRRVIRT